MNWMRGSSFHDDGYIDNDRSRGPRMRPVTADEIDNSLYASAVTRAEESAKQRRQEEFRRVLAEDAKRKEDVETMRRKEAASRSPVGPVVVDWTKL